MPKTSFNFEKVYKKTIKMVKKQVKKRDKKLYFYNSNLDYYIRLSNSSSV